MAANHALAASLYAAAAEAGHPQAQVHLAQMYEHGQGVQQDLEKALQLFRAAADQGHAEAIHRAGSMLEHGIGAQADLQAALRSPRSFVLPCHVHHRCCAQVLHQRSNTRPCQLPGLLGRNVRVRPWREEGLHSCSEVLQSCS